MEMRPHNAPATIMDTIFIPVGIMMPRSPPNIPRSTMVDIRSGWASSAHVSISTHSGARTARAHIGRMCLSMMFTL